VQLETALNSHSWNGSRGLRLELTVQSEPEEMP